MKITDIRTIPLAFGAANPVMSAGGINAARNALLVEIETDTGLVGLGEAGCAGGPLISTETVIQRELRPMLLDEDPRMIEALWQKMFVRTRQHGRRGLVMHAISGIDIALWDLAGKATGQPLYRLLGGFTDRVEVLRQRRLLPARQGHRRARRRGRALRRPGVSRDEDEGGPHAPIGSKLRGLTADAEVCQVTVAEDIARVAAVRRALGPEPRLMLDANCAWSPPPPSPWAKRSSPTTFSGSRSRWRPTTSTAAPRWRAPCRWRSPATKRNTACMATAS